MTPFSTFTRPRKPMAKISQRKLDRLAEEDRVRQAVIEAAGGVCALAPFQGYLLTELERPVKVPNCWGGPTYHHLEKAGQGGAFSVENGECLCLGHNLWVENEPLAADALGMVRHPSR